LVGLPWAVDFVKQFRSYLDGFLLFPGFPGLPEIPADITSIPLFLNIMQALKFDLAIQMHGSGEIVNPLVALWGAKRCAGYYLPGHYCPDKETFMEYPDYGPEASRHLRLMEFLGVPLQGEHLEFPLFDEDWKEHQQIQETYHLNDAYICIHPGARAVSRRWPTEYFANLADELSALGYQIVLTGSGEEAHLTQTVAEQMKAPAIDLGGKTRLGLLGALVSRARLVISNDTGMAHVAASLQIPSVILFAASSSERWAPQNKRLHKPVWQAMEMHPEEIFGQVQQHLQEIYANPV
jgi:ADP-heptose:LPS heptosyltransferase